MRPYKYETFVYFWIKIYDNIVSMTISTLRHYYKGVSFELRNNLSKYPMTGLD